MGSEQWPVGTGQVVLLPGQREVNAMMHHLFNIVSPARDAVKFEPPESRPQLTLVSAVSTKQANKSTLPHSKQSHCFLLSVAQQRERERERERA